MTIRPVERAGSGYQKCTCPMHGHVFYDFAYFGELCFSNLGAHLNFQHGIKVCACGFKPRQTYEAGYEFNREFGTHVHECSESPAMAAFWALEALGVTA